MAVGNNSYNPYGVQQPQKSNSLARTSGTIQDIKKNQDGRLSFDDSVFANRDSEPKSGVTNAADRLAEQAQNVNKSNGKAIAAQGQNVAQEGTRNISETTEVYTQQSVSGAQAEKNKNSIDKDLSEFSSTNKKDNQKLTAANKQLAQKSQRLKQENQKMEAMTSELEMLQAESEGDENLAKYNESRMKELGVELEVGEKNTDKTVKQLDKASKANQKDIKEVQEVAEVFMNEQLDNVCDADTSKQESIVQGKKSTAMRDTGRVMEITGGYLVASGIAVMAIAGWTGAGLIIGAAIVGAGVLLGGVGFALDREGSKTVTKSVETGQAWQDTSDQADNAARIAAADGAAWSAAAASATQTDKQITAEKKDTAVLSSRIQAASSRQQ